MQHTTFQLIRFPMSTKQFDKHVSSYSRITSEGEKYLFLQKLMYGLIVISYFGFFMLPIAFGVKNIITSVLISLIFGTIIGIALFVASKFFGYSAVHHTSYYLSPVADPVLRIENNVLFFVYKDIRDADLHPNRYVEYSIKLPDIQSVSINKATELIEIDAPYKFKVYGNSAGKKFVEIKDRDLYEKRGKVSFFNTLTNPNAFIEILYCSNIPVRIS